MWERGFLEPIKALTPDQIEQACEAAYANAVDLLEEADLLRANDRCARAYFLTHIACEELGKLPILTAAAVSEQIGHEVDWRRIDRVLRTHSNKIKQVLFMDSIVGHERLERGEESYEADVKRMRTYMDMKNASLYSAFVGTGFVRPLKAVPCWFYDKFRALAAGRIDAFEAMYLKPIRAAGGLAAFLSGPAFQRVDEILEVLTGPEGRAAFEAYDETRDESKLDELFRRLLRPRAEAEG